MAYGSYEQAVRALVEGGLRMINNMIPNPPTGAGRLPGAGGPRLRIEPVTQPSSQLRLPLTQPGRGAQTYSPAKSAGPGAAETIQSGQRALPAESSAQRGQRLLQEAQESRLLMTPRSGVGAAARGNMPEFSSWVFDRARTPRTVPVSAPSARALPPAAPVPAWAREQQLQIADPDMYRRILSIAENTASQRGLRTEDVMRALLSPEGLDSPYIKNLEGPSDVVVYSKPVEAASYTTPLGGVQTVDLRQAITDPNFVRATSGALTELAGSPSVSTVAQAGSRIPLVPLAGAGAVGLLGGVAAMLGNRQNEMPGAIEPAPVPGQTQLGVPTATPAGANTPAVTGAPVTTPAAPIAGSTNAIPGTANPSSLTPATAPAVRPGPPIAPAPAAPVVSAAGAGSVVQQRNDGDSNYRQAVQNAAQALRQDASNYGPGQIGAFYAAQEAYAKAPGRAEQIIGALRQAGAPSSIGMESDAAFKAWATANPELAYRLQLQMQPRGANQQMPVAQGSVIGTSVGTNFTNNALGQSRAAAVNAAYGTQGAADMADALKPQAYATLQAPRSAMYAGYGR